MEGRSNRRSEARLCQPAKSAVCIIGTSGARLSCASPLAHHPTISTFLPPGHCSLWWRARLLGRPRRFWPQDTRPSVSRKRPVKARDVVGLLPVHGDVGRMGFWRRTAGPEPFARLESIPAFRNGFRKPGTPLGERALPGLNDPAPLNVLCCLELAAAQTRAARPRRSTCNCPVQAGDSQRSRAQNGHGCSARGPAEH